MPNFANLKEVQPNFSTLTPGVVAPTPVTSESIWQKLANGAEKIPGGAPAAAAFRIAPQVVPAIKEIGSDLNNRITNDAKIQASSESAPYKFLDQAGQAAAAVSDTIGTGIKVLFPTEVKDAVKNQIKASLLQPDNANPLVNKTTGQVTPSPAYTSIVNWYKQLDPETQQHLGATGQIALLLSNALVPAAAKEGVSAATDVIDAAAPVIEKAANVTSDTGKAVVDVTKKAVASTPEKQLSKLTADWTNATPTNRAGFKNARAVLANSPTTPDFLAKQGLNPIAHVVDGQFVTADAADTLHETADQLSHETLRPSLQMADYSTPKTPVSEVISDAIKNVTSDTNSITEGDKAKIIKNIQSESDALKAKFPEGMTLTDMHDNKITYAKNGGYSPIKPAADNNLATANRSIASSLQKIVEAKAPESVPVKAFNKYLSQYHKAADYLTALDTKKAPVSLAQHVARAASKLTGAAIGAHLGGLPAEFAGYQVGKALEHAVENLMGAARKDFLNNLEKTNNPAFQKVQQFLRDKNAGSPGILKLPPATNKSPIPLGAPKDISAKAPYAAKAGYPLARDPKTGKVMKTFTSQLQSEKPLERSQPQAKAPATIKTSNAIGDKPTPKTTNVKRTLSSGFAKIPSKIPQEAQRIMSDLTDYVANSYKPDAATATKLEQDAADIFDKYIGGKAPLTLKGLANKFGRVLEKNNFGKGPARDEAGKFSK